MADLTATYTVYSANAAATGLLQATIRLSVLDTAQSVISVNATAGGFVVMGGWENTTKEAGYATWQGTVEFYAVTGEALRIYLESDNPLDNTNPVATCTTPALANVTADLQTIKGRAINDPGATVTVPVSIANETTSQADLDAIIAAVAAAQADLTTILTGAITEEDLSTLVEDAVDVTDTHTQATNAATDAASVKAKFTGITLIAKWLGLLAGKTADAATLAEVNATTAGADFSNVTDSLEAIRDRGDLAWITGNTTAPLDAQGTRDAMKLAPTAGDPATGSVDKHLDDTVTQTTASAIRGDLGMASANLDAQLLPLASISLGTGARTVTITVTDGTDALEGARVRVTSGSTSQVGDTNVSGVIVFGIDDATWSVTITKSGYSFTPTTLVVAADTSHTYAMTEATIPASDPDFVTGYLYCYDENGEVEEDVIVQMKIVSLSGSGSGYDTATRSETSDATGLVTFTNLVPGALYSIRRGTETDWVDITISAAATDPYEMDNVFGEDS